MVLLISYDLVGRERPAAYSKVKKYIEDHSISCRRPLFSQWFVETSSTPDEWANALINAGLIDSNDQLFVVQVKWPYQGWLRQPEWDWLNARI